MEDGMAALVAFRANDAKITAAADTVLQRGIE